MKNKWIFFLMICASYTIKCEAVSNQEPIFNVHKSYDGLSANNSTQIEAKEMQEGHDLYQKLNSENSLMMGGDQQIMKEGYDPNEAYNRADPNREYEQQRFQKQESEIYGR
jgi:hypothetical protein